MKGICIDVLIDFIKFGIATKGNCFNECSVLEGGPRKLCEHSC